MIPRLVIGVDPGVNGALAFVRTKPGAYPELIAVHDLPLVVVHHKHELLLPQIVAMMGSMLAEIPVANTTVIIESVHAAPRQGVSSMFRFGFAAGAVEGIAVGMGFLVQKVAPLTWQQMTQTKAGPDAARYRVSQLFPRQADKNWFVLK